MIAQHLGQSPSSIKFKLRTHRWFLRSVKWVNSAQLHQQHHNMQLTSISARSPGHHNAEHWSTLHGSKRLVWYTWVEGRFFYKNWVTKIEPTATACREPWFHQYDVFSRARVHARKLVWRMMSRRVSQTEDKSMTQQPMRRCTERRDSCYFRA